MPVVTVDTPGSDPGRVLLYSRTAIVAAARVLLGAGTEVTMPGIARTALVSEAAACRYFPDLPSDALPPGSNLVFSRGTTDEHPHLVKSVTTTYREVEIRLRMRTRAEIEPRRTPRTGDGRDRCRGCRPA
ncbi:SAM-dependent methyltransferase [Streptomyces sp. NPDC094038]|uniref:SAM-dependent methyltransferase n=1 Tax=Streptomyces sp. NPDC094038 TaxID=3366055 RepID=UPI0037FEE750